MLPTDPSSTTFATNKRVKPKSSSEKPKSRDAYFTGVQLKFCRRIIRMSHKEHLSLYAIHVYCNCRRIQFRVTPLHVRKKNGGGGAIFYSFFTLSTSSRVCQEVVPPRDELWESLHIKMFSLTFCKKLCEMKQSRIKERVASAVYVPLCLCEVLLFSVIQKSCESCGMFWVKNKNKELLLKSYFKQVCVKDLQYHHISLFFNIERLK